MDSGYINQDIAIDFTGRTLINVGNPFKFHIFKNVIFLIGLTRSEKTSVMTTPKRPGTQIW